MPKEARERGPLPQYRMRQSETPAPAPGFRNSAAGSVAYEERRSAVQVPEQSPEPAVHMPDPSVADRRPWPRAL